MKLIHYKTGILDVNTYLLYDEKSKEAVLFDVGGGTEKILADIKRLELKLKYILNTHGHFDHVMGAKTIQDAIKTPFYVNIADAEFVKNLAIQLETYNLEKVDPPSISGFISEITDLSIGEHKIKVIETPGHSPGGVCFLINKILFSGDTLFLDFIGRTDLPGGNAAQLVSSIKNKLFKLPDETVVYPGHDGFTNIGYEKLNNIYVR